MVAIFCMHPGDALCELTFMPTCNNVNSVVSKDSPKLQCNQPVIHFLTESGLKKDIFMSSNLSVSLAECFLFLGGGGGWGWVALRSTAQLVKTLSNTSCQNI